MKLPTHPSIDVAALQAVADAVAPGLATVTLRTELCALHEPDTRPKYAGCNKLAIRSTCPDCKGTGDGADAEGYPAMCEPCRGLGELHEDPHMPVQYVVVDIGHRTRVEVGHLSHPPGVHKGRRDLFTARTHDELAAIVKAAVGQAALEVAKAVGGEPGLEHDRAMALLDAAHASGAVAPDVVAQHRAQRVAARTRGAPPHAAARHPARPDRETFVTRACTRCGRSTSAASLDAVTDHLRARHTGGDCVGEATVTREVTRVHSVDDRGQHVQTDAATVVPDADVLAHEARFDAAVAVCVAFAAVPMLCAALVQRMARESRDELVTRMGAAGLVMP